MQFETKTYKELVEYIYTIDPIKYAKTRNYINGTVTELSPYITHGVITIDEIVKILLSKYTVDQAEMLLKELLRREYFIQVHYRKGDMIFSDMEISKINITKYDLLPKSITEACTKSDWVNKLVLQLEQTGYLHNHQRMWLASYCTHYAKLYRRKFADWTYYHFIDGELGSNHLSRQRVESTFSHKPYFMNEENLSRYRHGIKDNIFSGTYEQVSDMLFDENRKSGYMNDIDNVDILTMDLSSFEIFNSNDFNDISINLLNPRDLHCNKILSDQINIVIIDTNFASKHPRSQKRIDFVVSYAKLYDISIYIGCIDKIISSLLSNNNHITCYETHNPFYRQANEEYKNQIKLLPYLWCSPAVKFGYNKKFFGFWEKSVSHLYDIQRNLK